MLLIIIVAQKNADVIWKGFSFAKLASLHEYIRYQVPAFM